MHKDFINQLISNGEDMPPETQEQKLQDSINVLAHRMDENFKTIQKEINNIKKESEEMEYEKNTDTQYKEGNGQAKSLQNDTIENHEND